MSTLSATYAPAAPPPAVPRVHDASPRDERACLRSHLHDVGHIRTHPAGLRSRFRDAAKRNIVAAYAYFLVQGVLQWLSAFIFSPATAFTDPLNTFATLIIYPVINIALGILVAVLYVGSMLGGGWVIQLISDNYADGYSMANWANPGIFGPSSRETIDAARPLLTGQVATTQTQQADSAEQDVDFTQLKTVRIFSVPLAKALLLMSSIVYERNDKLVKEAADIFDRTQKKYTPGTHAYDVEMKRAEDKLLESEAKIKVQAAKWNLAYDGVSDLSTVSGPFASIFYTPLGSSDQPFIVLCFKGTTPLQFSEWLVDATISKTPANVFFGPGTGKAHSGFYDDLFVRNDGNGGPDGYGSIVRTLRHVAGRIKANGKYSQTENQIPLFVTGHSLGSALASLCYARFLASESDLGPDLKLKDCYVFGTPRLGDGDFASAFEHNLATPLDRANILWRVRDHVDLVCSVPPGVTDAESLRGTVSSSSLLNYAHLGPEIRVFPVLPYSPPYWKANELGAFHEATEVRVTGGHASQQELMQAGGGLDLRKTSARVGAIEGSRGGKNWLRWALALLPSPLYDHFPAVYYAHLTNLINSSLSTPVSSGRLAASLNAFADQAVQDTKNLTDFVGVEAGKAEGVFKSGVQRMKSEAKQRL